MNRETKVRRTINRSRSKSRDTQMSFMFQYKNTYPTMFTPIPVYLPGSSMETVRQLRTNVFSEAK